MTTDQGDYTKTAQEDPALTPSNAGDNSASDDDIIELTDVIKKGEQFEKTDDTFQFENAPGEAQKKEQDVLGPNDDDLEKIIAGLETELDTEESDAEEGEPEVQDLDVREAEEDEPSPPVVEQAPVLSQEELKAHLTEVVREVVEKTVRDTVAEVTERVIKETIDALKESLQPESE